jgi:hypothetical protein
MAKKILALCAALVAFAVVPAVAAASPELTHPTGTTLPTGTKIKATNVGNTQMTSSAGTITCTTATMTGTVTKNSGTAIEGDIESAHFTGLESENRCEGGLGAVKVTVTSVPWCLKNTKTAHQFELRGGKCSEASRAVKFTLDTSVGECKYEKASVLGTFTTHPEDAILHASTPVFTKYEGGFLCPSTGELHMSFTLETDTTASNDPIYIS